MRNPSGIEVGEFIERQRSLPFSYNFAGATRDKSRPSGFNVDHNRVKLGSGSGVFDRAVEAVIGWKMFYIGWVELLYPDAPIKQGVVVGVLVRALGLSVLNACRIVYTIDEGASLRRFGFAYGTLPDHAESGEERFTVEWDASDNSVWYDLYAISKPRHPLARVAYPWSRLLQKRFATDSKKAMFLAANASRGDR